VSLSLWSFQWSNGHPSKFMFEVHFSISENIFTMSLGDILQYSLYIRIANIYWRNSSLFSTPHPTFLHSWRFRSSTEHILFRTIFGTFLACSHFRKYSYHVTRFVILFFPGAFITNWLKMFTFHFFRGLKLPLNRPLDTKWICRA
jgi:hypothetical protein